MSDQSNSQTRKQHYNPRLLLRGFATENQNGVFQTNVFDKHTDKTFISRVEDIAVERDFNTASMPQGLVSWEANLAKVESIAAPFINRIRETRKLTLEPTERAALAFFGAVQFVRGVDYRARYVHMVRATKDLLIQREGEAGVPEDLLAIPDDDEARAAAFHAFKDDAPEYARLFLVKDIALFEAPKGSSFLIGDAPVSMTNRRKFGPYGNIGLAVLGIEIYLPISTDLTIAFLCDSIMGHARDSILKVEGAIAQTDPQKIADPEQRQATEAAIQLLRDQIALVKPPYDAFLSGAAIPLTADNVMFQNSLQIRNAERFVMCKQGEFSLVKRMISDDERYRTGQRIQVG